MRELNKRFRGIPTASFSVISLARTVVSSHVHYVYPRLTKRQARLQAENNLPRQPVATHVELLPLPGYRIGVGVLGLDPAQSELWAPNTWDWVLGVFSDYTLVVFCCDSVFSMNETLQVKLNFTPHLTGTSPEQKRTSHPQKKNGNLKQNTVDGGNGWCMQAFDSFEKALVQQAQYDSLIRCSGVTELGCKGETVK